MILSALTVSAILGLITIFVMWYIYHDDPPKSS
jgi:hypothetical protein